MFGLRDESQEHIFVPGPRAEGGSIGGGDTSDA